MHPYLASICLTTSKLLATIILLMKSLLRNTVIHTLALFLLPKIIPGVLIYGGIGTLLLGGFVLTLMNFILKPILNIISFPFHLITLGLFSVITNSFLLYLLTIFVPGIIIRSFSYPRTEWLGFVIPSISFNTFFAFVITAVVLAALLGGIKWLIEK